MWTVHVQTCRSVSEPKGPTAAHSGESQHEHKCGYNFTYDGAQSWRTTASMVLWGFAMEEAVERQSRQGPLQFGYLRH